MGYKNRTHKDRRIISPNKYKRIFKNNLDYAGVAYRQDRSGAIYQSISACKVGEIIYARFFCKAEGTSETYCIRYKTDESNDDILAFTPYPHYTVFLSFD